MWHPMAMEGPRNLRSSVSEIHAAPSSLEEGLEMEVVGELERSSKYEASGVNTGNDGKLYVKLWECCGNYGKL